MSAKYVIGLQKHVQGSRRPRTIAQSFDNSFTRLTSYGAVFGLLSICFLTACSLLLPLEGLSTQVV